MVETDERIAVRVLERRMASASVVVLRLAAAAEGAALPEFTAGSHIDVHLAPAVTRPYSLCGDPADRGSYRLAILLEAASRGGSIAAHALAEQSILPVSRPRNHFPLREDAEQSILLGAGIGIAPLLSMAWRLHALGASFDLHYSVRRMRQAAFLDELTSGALAGHTTLHAGDEPGGRFVVDRDLPAPAPGTALYLCGPGRFMDDVAVRLQSGGWAPEQILTERFVPAASETTAPSGSFIVALAGSGLEFEIGSHETIAEVLTRHGMEIALSCEQGMCGTCLTRVLDGTPDHRDSYQSDKEKATNNHIALCCSRASSRRLTLDL